MGSDARVVRAECRFDFRDWVVESGESGSASSELGLRITYRQRRRASRASLRVQGG